MDQQSSYQKVASQEAHKGSFDTCLLLYSGGLDTSVMLKWIGETYNAEVVALTIDLGQTADDLEAIRQKALDLGAKEAIVYDAKDEFADILLTEAIKANADYQDGYALSTPLGRVAISRVVVKIANELGLNVIAHGSTGKGNDQVRFESYITTLAPHIKIIAPVREWGMGRQEEIAYAEKHNIPVVQKKDKPYSYDENMWGNTGEGGEVENPELIPPLENILQWCNTPQKAPDKEELVHIEFEKGKPVKLNDQAMKMSELIAACNKIGAKHGVGVFHLIEDRLVGLKVRGIYENPAATMLIEAHRKLEKLVSTREENELKRFIDTKWAYLTYAAKWYDPVMYHIHAFINSQNKKVTGKVTLRLYKGNCTVVALESPYSLFDENLATFERDATFNQNAAAGFIEIYNLAQRTAFNVYDFEKELFNN
ncbi:MAG TPA: argininosuccinate synthase [Caldithrix abyssi]|uniref:Argininosuccinate synthase n=1 Tax=Caldithrix abyssi TaxID=187145 RepID=A0A7V1LP56_CALAY|nr:argininosuccinate synthase [Caldithrix abyssi]